MKNRILSLGEHQQKILTFLLGATLLFFTSAKVNASDTQEAETLVKTICTTCHKFEGKEESRFNLKAPDLMWGGSKYQRDWLIRWLTGNEPLLYAKNYRWDQKQEPRCPRHSNRSNKPME